MDSSPQPRLPLPDSRAADPAAQRDADIELLLGRGEADAAFALIAMRYESKVYRLCYALLRNPEAAQDAAQESLLRVWRALPRFDGRAALSTWIYAITRNRCLTALAQASANLSLTDEAVLAEAEAIPTPSRDVDTAALLRQLVAALPPTPSRVVTLYYFEERALAEVAQMLGLPEGTVKTHLFRARAALLGQLASLGLADPELWIK